MIIRIGLYAFDLGQKYVEGHVLTANEAKELDRLRCENIRNNVKRLFVDKALSGTGANDLIEPEALAALIQKVEHYALHYEFEPVGDRPRQTWFERELRAFAQSKVESEARQSGIEYTEEELLAEVERQIRLTPVIAEAMKRAKAVNETAQAELLGLLS